MTNRFEFEQKFFCNQYDDLVNILNKLDFKKENELLSEVDEYFTDINCEYIKNRTRLRIRKTNNKTMELTFKGKSNDFGNAYAKMESNIDLNIDSYHEIKDLLFSIGYYSYCIVDKIRTTFSKVTDGINYNVMIDNIKNVGSFVEFEILTEDNPDCNIISDKFNEFMLLFKNIKLEKANLPYRDFVAKNIYDNFVKNKEFKSIYVNFDKNKKELALIKELLNKLKSKQIDIVDKSCINNENTLILDEINNIDNINRYSIMKILLYLNVFR